jgi:hypothetical protein
MTRTAKSSERAAILAELLHVGNLMSNVCANVSQPSWTVDERAREQMGELYRAWDKAANRFHELKKRRPG